jgi:hypothetical protein
VGYGISSAGRREPFGNGVLIVVEEDWQAALADRCARALGYVVHEI